jgi:hypothetical protein
LNPSGAGVASPVEETTMKKNVSSRERALRVVAGGGMLACSVLAPLPMLLRALAFGAGGLYMIGTALAGTCLGYKMMGISTCSVDPKKAR